MMQLKTSNKHTTEGLIATHIKFISAHNNTNPGCIDHGIILAYHYTPANNLKFKKLYLKIKLSHHMTCCA